MLTVLPIAITASALPSGTAGTAYSTTLSATGGNPPYTWKIASGLFPKGIRLNKKAGAISGKTKQVGSLTFTVEVLDQKTKRTNGHPPTQNTATARLSITINPAPWRSSPTSTVGKLRRAASRLTPIPRSTTFGRPDPDWCHDPGGDCRASLPRVGVAVAEVVDGEHPMAVVGGQSIEQALAQPVTENAPGSSNGCWTFVDPSAMTESWPGEPRIAGCWVRLLQKLPMTADQRGPSGQRMAEVPRTCREGE